MAAPTKLHFEACSKTIIRRRKNAFQKDTVADLNDHFRWREQQFHRKTSCLAKPLQTNEHVLEKAPLAAMALTLFYLCDPSKLSVRILSKSFVLLEVNSLSPCSIEGLSPKSKSTENDYFSIGFGLLQVPLRRSGVESEGESSSQWKLACCGGSKEPQKGGEW